MHLKKRGEKRINTPIFSSYKNSSVTYFTILYFYMLIIQISISFNNFKNLIILKLTILVTFSTNDI